MMKSCVYPIVVALLLAGGPPTGSDNPGSDKKAPLFAESIRAAEGALGTKDFDLARMQIDRALERDPKSPHAWDLKARWAEAVGDKDELVYALHKRIRLAAAQKASGPEIEALKKRLVSLDPVAQELFKMRDSFEKKLLALAEQYEKDSRPHSAIRAHQQILALDPERVA